MSTLTFTSATRLYDESLAEASDPRQQRQGWQVRYDDGRVRPLDLARWCGPVNGGDEQLLRRCVGPTLDVGCGPGRLTATLAAREVPVLGIDVAPGAVRLARRSGGSVVRRSVFGPVPGSGTWAFLLLADGNIGIGGDPVRLLLRARTLLRPGGSVLCEVDPPGQPTGPVRVRLETGGGRASRWFDWAHVGADRAGMVAVRAGLRVTEVWQEEGRWFTRLAES